MADLEVNSEGVSFFVRAVFMIVRVINFFLHLISNKLPFSLSVILTSFFLALPVVGSWYVFLIGYYLPFPWGAVLIWSFLFFIVILAAAIDYVRSA